MGGVFINYRTVDDPLGAALIHDRLALRFGRDNVFRDCVSLAPGAHYPSSIRIALENAAVLVAVIGPRWLTLTDESAVRLIDREHDWVRLELALAFDTGIPVLPVLLKDTPANAVMPMMTDLPVSIRPLATIQALEISQRRLGADLEMLEAAIARFRPVPPASVDVFFDMVEALEQVPSLSTEHDRTAMINMLPASIASSVAYSARRRTHAANLLTTCRGYPHGLADLLDVLRRLHGDDCTPLRRLVELAPLLPP